MLNDIEKTEYCSNAYNTGINIAQFLMQMHLTPGTVNAGVLTDILQLLEKQKIQNIAAMEQLQEIN